MKVLRILFSLTYVDFKGKRMATDKICGVSILRAGETMEQAVCDVYKDIRIGKILIQTNFHTGEPEVTILVFFFLLLLLKKLFLFLAVLSSASKRYKRLQGYLNGCHSSNRGSCNDGNSCTS